MLVQLDSRSTSRTRQLEIVLRTRKHCQGSSIVLKLTLDRWRILNRNSLSAALMHSTMLWCNHYILIRLSLPLEVKVEISLIRKNHLFSAHFIYEELSKVKFARLITHTFDLGLVSHY